MAKRSTFRLQVYRNSNSLSFTTEPVEATAPDHLTDFEAVLRACYRTVGKRRGPKDRIIIQKHLYDDRWTDYEFVVASPSQLALLKQQSA